MPESSSCPPSLPDWTAAEHALTSTPRKSSWTGQDEMKGLVLDSTLSRQRRHAVTALRALSGVISPNLHNTKTGGERSLLRNAAVTALSCPYPP